jgi:putative salt-induced outer membrane protein YdiY
MKTKDQRKYYRPAAMAALLGSTLAGTAAAGEAPAPEEKPKWITSAGLGLTLTSGNSESITFTGNFDVSYKQAPHEFAAGALAGYGKAKPASTDAEPDPDYEKNTDFVKGFVQYNRLFGERWFAYGRVDAQHDDIAEIMYRVALSPGVGYYFIKQPKLTLSGEVGPGYVFERIYNSDTGEYDNNDYASLRLAERLEWKISETARLWQSVEFLPEITNFENFIINAELGVEADLSRKMAVRLQLLDTYDNEPSPGREENDLKLIAGLTYKF